VTDERPRGLISLSERPTLRTYLPLLARNRQLAWSIARNDLRSRHGGLVLGWLWNLLDPLMMLGVYWLVFGVLLAGRRPEHFLAFLAVGIFLFRFTQSSVVGGAEAIQKNVGMIRQVRFARATLPLAEVLRNLLTLYWQLPIIVTIVLLTFGRFRSGWLILLLVLIPMLALFAFGGALLFARLAHGLADVTNFLPYAFRILFYASGILFPIDTILADSPLRDWLPVNPLYSFITLARHLTLAPVAETAVLWISVTAWTAVSITLGLRLFIAAEHRYGRG
jgi:teichoic acid transport system permease protein